MKITVIGLGEAEGDLTQAAWAALQSAERVVLKTEKTPVTESLKKAGIAFSTLDALYEKSRNFETLNQNILQYCKRMAGDFVYCVNGSGQSDRSVQAMEKVFDVQIISSIPLGNALAQRHAGAQLRMSGVEFLEAHWYDGMYLADWIITEIDDAWLAGDIKLKLMEFFDADTEIELYDGNIRTLALSELDRQSNYGYHCSIYIPHGELLKRKRFSYNDLVEIITLLRAPGGCPWDREQTHKSIRKNVIEEAYEVADAIDSEDDEHLQEETGDLILQSVLHAVIASEEGSFTSGDMVTGICEKLIRRHSHIFGDAQAENGEKALQNWEKEKLKEKGFESVTQSMRAVAEAMPSLMRAQKIMKKAQKSGLSSAVTKGQDAKALLQQCVVRMEEKESIFSQLLWLLVNSAVQEGMDAEERAQRIIVEWIQEFEKVENEHSNRQY